MGAMPLHIVRQDITLMRCDAIVNTTNEEMIGYSGVDLAVHSRAGRELDEECAHIAPLELGFAKITGGYRLGCKYIIHTSGPVWEGGGRGERAILRSCYLESLRLAKQYKCKTVAFPLISSGVYGFPKDRVLTYATEIIDEFLKENEMTIFICIYDKKSYEISSNLFEGIKEFIDDNYVRSHNDEYFAASISLRHRRARRVESIPDYHIEAPMSYRMDEDSYERESLESFISTKAGGFSETLFSFINKSGMSDVECYKRANVTKQVFSKIKKPNYKPNKTTALAFAVALCLDLDDAKRLLSSAGLALSHSSIFDLIVEYFVTNRIYDIHMINQVLFDYDQELLGSVPKE